MACLWLCSLWYCEKVGVPVRISGMSHRMWSCVSFSFYITFSKLLWFLRKVSGIYKTLKNIFVYFPLRYALILFIFEWELILPMCFIYENSQDQIKLTRFFMSCNQERNLINYIILVSVLILIIHTDTDKREWIIFWVVWFFFFILSIKYFKTCI